MKKISTNSYKNKFRNCKGDYVVEAKINYNLYEQLNSILTTAFNSKQIEGFEFTKTPQNNNSCILMMNPCETQLLPLGKVELFNGPNNLRFNKNIEFCCVSVYGRKAHVLIKEVIGLLSKNNVNANSVYQLV